MKTDAAIKILDDLSDFVKTKTTPSSKVDLFEALQMARDALKEKADIQKGQAHE